jgi:hypothetical protein
VLSGDAGAAATGAAAAAVSCAPATVATSRAVPVSMFFIDGFIITIRLGLYYLLIKRQVLNFFYILLIGAQGYIYHSYKHSKEYKERNAGIDVHAIDGGRVIFQK